MQNEFYNAYDITQLDAPGPRDRDAQDHRTFFQIDRDRVIFSHAFRRLQSKTQVFQSGEYDFYRTRLTHSIEVARIGRSICEYLQSKCTPILSDKKCIDPDLLEAVGISHDLGHPPFGHIGERKLNELMAPFGGFEGNAQTLRILTELIYARQDGPRGMRPTRAFLDGILKYKKLFSEASTSDSFPENHFIYDDQKERRDFVLGDIPSEQIDTINDFKSIECQIMDWADDTAYCTHDILDGIKAGFLTVQRIEKWAEGKSIGPVENACLEDLIDVIKKERVEAVFGLKIGHFIRACTLAPTENFMTERTQRYAYNLRIHPEIVQESKLYKSIALDLIFKSPLLQQIEFKGGKILENLWEALDDNYLKTIKRPLNILPEPIHQWVRGEGDPAKRARTICDFLANLTDLEAIRLYRRLFDPEFGSIRDLA